MKTLTEQIGAKPRAVPLKAIQMDDTTYSFRLENTNRLNQYKKELVKLDPKDPITLEEVASGEFRILDGFQRVQALLDLKKDIKTISSFVIPGPYLLELDRFRLLRDKNILGPHPYGLYEKARYAYHFYKRGFPRDILAYELSLSFHDLDDFLVLGEAPLAFGEHLNQNPISPMLAAILFRRYRGWMQTPYHKEANRIAKKLLTLSKKEPLTMKSWRFYLDFYWESGRPTRIG